ncbi:MAG: PCMD domain-containing protein [Paramuribaculum sp.]|nr:PCMD domain-containing protein [Paramuribaculum sp.]
MNNRIFKVTLWLSILLLFGIDKLSAQSIEKIPYGDFNNWLKRTIRESVVIGGHNRILYEVGPETVIADNLPYCKIGDSPWATSNVYAKISGVTKASNTVFPHFREEGDICAKLCTKMEKVKVLGTVNIEYLVAGSLFLGEVVEPITDINHPNSHINMGIKYDRRPTFLNLDYMLEVPFKTAKIKATGFAKNNGESDNNNAKIYVLLQKRWEDAEGNIHASRVGTGGELLTNYTNWKNGHKIEIKYGDQSENEALSWLGLKKGDDAFYAFNSKGELVKIHEDEWASADEIPTHLILVIRSSCENPEEADDGTALYVDNIALEY